MAIAIYARLGNLQKEAKKSRDAKAAVARSSNSDVSNSVKMHALNAEIEKEGEGFSLNVRHAREVSDFTQAVRSKRVKEVFLRGSAFKIEYAGADNGVLKFKLDPNGAESPFLASNVPGDDMVTRGFTRVYVMAH